MKENTKAALATVLNVSRSMLYYVSGKEKRDWETKTKVEEVLREHPSYGSRRVSQHLKLNRKGVRRVMRKYGIKPYRRRATKWRKKRKIKVIYANLLFGTIPSYPQHVWAADFTEVYWHGTKLYVATVIDLYTREIVGVVVSLRKGAQLTLQALWHALLSHPHPALFHSDNGTDYDARSFVSTLTNLNVLISRSHPGCPWENGYQESFYNQFKVDLGDPNRFTSLGEIVAEIHRTIWTYNTSRIHSALKMSPRQFAQKVARDTMVGLVS